MCCCVVQERLLGEDGNPRKTKDGEDPYHMGLVLEWVYGTIVSTAEKARDSAKKPLGEPLVPRLGHLTQKLTLEKHAFHLHVLLFQREQQDPGGFKSLWKGFVALNFLRRWLFTSSCTWADLLGEVQSSQVQEDGL